MTKFLHTLEPLERSKPGRRFEISKNQSSFYSLGFSKFFDFAKAKMLFLLIN